MLPKFIVLISVLFLFSKLSNVYQVPKNAGPLTLNAMYQLSTGWFNLLLWKVFGAMSFSQKPFHKQTFSPTDIWLTYILPRDIQLTDLGIRHLSTRHTFRLTDNLTTDTWKNRYLPKDIWPKTFGQTHRTPVIHLANRQFINIHLDNIHLNNIHLNNIHLNNIHLNNRHLDNIHLDNWHLDNSYLDNKHLDIRCLANRHFVNRHLANRHLVNIHLANTIGTTDIGTTDILNNRHLDNRHLNNRP